MVLEAPGMEQMRKIQTKIIAIVVLATVCVSVVAGIVSTAVTRYSTTAALEKNALETAELAALAAKNMISTYTLTITEMASNATFWMTIFHWMKNRSSFRNGRIFIICGLEVWPI